ncbi:unnamed protein product [Cutaneotrichosporon oleaginosum]
MRPFPDSPLLSRFISPTLRHSSRRNVRSWTVFWVSGRPRVRCLHAAGLEPILCLAARRERESGCRGAQTALFGPHVPPPPSPRRAPAHGGAVALSVPPFSVPAYAPQRRGNRRRAEEGRGARWCTVARGMGGGVEAEASRSSRRREESELRGRERAQRVLVVEHGTLAAWLKGVWRAVECLSGPSGTCRLQAMGGMGRGCRLSHVAARALADTSCIVKAVLAQCRPTTPPNAPLNAQLWRPC